MNQFRIDFLQEYTLESIIDEVRRIEKITKNGTITQKDIKEYGRISVSTIYKHFSSLAEPRRKLSLLFFLLYDYRRFRFIGRGRKAKRLNTARHMNSRFVCHTPCEDLGMQTYHPAFSGNECFLFVGVSATKRKSLLSAPLA